VRRNLKVATSSIFYAGVTAKAAPTTLGAASAFPAPPLVTAVDAGQRASVAAIGYQIRLSN